MLINYSTHLCTTYQPQIFHLMTVTYMQHISLSESPLLSPQTDKPFFFYFLPANYSLIVEEKNRASYSLNDFLQPKVSNSLKLVD